MLDQIREQFAHQAWAEADLYRVMAGFPPIQADRETLTKLHHLHTVLHLYLQLWRGDDPKHVPATDFPSLVSLQNYGQMTHELLAAYLAGVKPADLEGTVHVSWFPGEPFHPTIGQTMLHLQTHSAHHRGQISARIRHLGGESPTLDFIHWLWKGRPKATWV